MLNTEEFSEVDAEWDLSRLHSDLAKAKGKGLTEKEKTHLKGLLCGYSPTEIAEKLKKNPKGLEVDLCNTLYHYVKSIVNKQHEKLENWRNIREWLEESGYKKNLNIHLNQLFPANGIIDISNVKIESHISVEKIRIENHSISIEAKIHLSIPSIEKS